MPAKVSFFHLNSNFFCDFLAGFGIFAYLCIVKTNVRLEVAAPRQLFLCHETYWYKIQQQPRRGYGNAHGVRTLDFNSA